MTILTSHRKKGAAMIRESVVGDVPRIDTTAYVDPAAVIIGRVIIGPNCYIGPGVVIRADRFSADDDIASITIGSGCSIQDLAVLHVHAENSIAIGDDAVINHGAIIHGTTSIGRNCFIGAKSVITHASLGDSVFTRVMSVIETVNIASERYIEINTVINTQDAADRLRPITTKEKEFMERAVMENREYAVRYKYSLEK
jgi:carbonic anhydrase/acetyltransferase-like protein (isoleucine patch superfamily)